MVKSHTRDLMGLAFCHTLNKKLTTPLQIIKFSGYRKQCVLKDNICTEASV